MANGHCISFLCVSAACHCPVRWENGHHCLPTPSTQHLGHAFGERPEHAVPYSAAGCSSGGVVVVVVVVVAVVAVGADHAAEHPVSEDLCDELCVPDRVPCRRVDHDPADGRAKGQGREGSTAGVPHGGM